MNKRTKFNRVQDFTALLDSDDELPDTYNEDPDTPAYRCDNRFNLDIKFEWIKKVQKTIPVSDSAISTKKEIVNNNKVENNYLLKGTLFKTDVYCLSQIAENRSENLLVWFFNFLLHRDMQSDYKFLKSCLVHNDITKNIYSENHAKLIERKKRFKFVIS